MKNRKLNGLFIAAMLTIAIFFVGIMQYIKVNEKSVEVNNNTNDKAALNEVFSSILDNAKKEQQILTEAIYNTTFNDGKIIPGIENANELYTVYSLARAEFQADDFYAAVYEKISEQLSILNNDGKVYDEINDEYISQKSILSGEYASQTYAKIALCVEALGRNIDDVGGFNLIDKLVSRNIYNSSNSYNREAMILFAIDAMNCTLPNGDEFLTRAELVNIILDDVDNQIDNSVLWESVDSAAMSIQPLAPYITKEIDGVDKEAVITACDKAINFIKSMQSEDGTYGDSYSSSNVWSLSQVMFTAGVFDCDILFGDDFVKNDVTLFDVAAAFVDINEKKVDETLMAFQPEQLLRGINACIRSVDKANSLLDTSDAAYIAADA